MIEVLNYKVNVAENIVSQGKNECLNSYSITIELLPITDIEKLIFKYKRSDEAFT
jgi:hypothetical protein